MTEHNTIFLVFEQQRYLDRIKAAIKGKSFVDSTDTKRKITDVDFSYTDFEELFRLDGHAFVSVDLVLSPYDAEKHFLYYDRDAERKVEELMKDFVSTVSYSEEGMQGRQLVNLDVELSLPWN